jgi:GxxExxY protein
MNFIHHEEHEGHEGKIKLTRRICMDFDKLSNKVIGLAIEVHKELGPGLFENTYKQCLAYECKRGGLHCTLEVELPVFYKGSRIECGYRIDMLIENQLILELKCVEKVLPIHEAQLITYLKLSGKSTGLLINFNEKLLKRGIKRFVL